MEKKQDTHNILEGNKDVQKILQTGMCRKEQECAEKFPELSKNSGPTSV